MTNVGKFIIIFILVLLGLFGVIMINTNVTKVNPETNNSTLSIPTISPSPSPVIIKPMVNEASSTSPQTEITKAVIKTAKGDIELTFYPKDAPNTVNNFVQKAQSGFYNNLVFHRVEDWVIQGGDPLGNGTGGGNIPVEFNTQPFIVGSLGIASRGDGQTQNDAQFFITKKDSPFLNGQYTNFGIVTKGMDVVSNIEIGDAILQIQLIP